MNAGRVPDWMLGTGAGSFPIYYVDEANVAEFPAAEWVSPLLDYDPKLAVGLFFGVQPVPLMDENGGTLLEFLSGRFESL
jgi:hypothetical protein